MLEDPELLHRYAEQASDEAFAELVRRHLNLVYSVALRQVGGDVHLAEDVTQQVFAALARKAARLSGRTSLSGWLYRSAHFAASDVVRAERRRKTREQESLLMQPTTHPPLPVDWERVRPILDTVIAELGERDRDAVSLRFLDGRSFADIATRLRLSENAARMRVERALDKLHAALARRGITSTTTAVGLAVAAQVSTAAPAGLATSVTGLALGGTASGGGLALLGFFTMSKITTGIISAAVLALATTAFVELRANDRLRTELRTLTADGGDPASLQREGRNLNAALQKLGGGNPETAALLRLQQRTAVLAARPDGVVDSELLKASSWSNAGRATPEAANRTFHWAMFSGDVDAVAEFVSFDDNTPAKREAFMAHFSEAVRARYRTPERVLAAAFFGAGQNNLYSADDAFQILSVRDETGGNGERAGQKRVSAWYSMASGSEFGGSDRWQSTPDGWAPAGHSLATDWEIALQLLDPATGERVRLTFEQEFQKKPPRTTAQP